MLKKLIENIIELLGEKYTLNYRNEVLTAIEQYVTKKYYSLRQTKNVIFRTEPVDFNQNYIPLTLTGIKSNIRLNDISEFLSKFNKVGIIGSAGSGKTTLLRYIAIKSVETQYKFPVLLNLRNFNSLHQTFEDFVAEEISDRYSDEIKILFESDKFLFLFDGYDEIDYVEGSDFINQLDSFITKFALNDFVITSRPGTNIEGINPLYIFNIEPLNDDDIYLFIENINIPSQLKRSIFKSIEQHSELREILNIPLFLSLYIVSYNSRNTDLSNKKSIFFRNILDALFSQHDSASKLGYVREKVSNLNKDEIEKVSSILAFRLLFSSRFEVSKDQVFSEFELIKNTSHLNFENEKLLFDLTITVNILIKSENYYLFPHILLLEYLAAIFISRLDSLSKVNFYERLYHTTKTYLSINLFEFLYELDERSFVQQFMLPNLKKIIYQNNWKKVIEIDDFQLQTFFEFIHNTLRPIKVNEGVSKEELDLLLESLNLEYGKDGNDLSNSLFDIL
ncbi:NACHT domain-containing protein [Flavobacterium cupreum]|uniref:NACHT domain-containing protein n=1 Tax=Flavobacterium cupreum TaxID=2133766 RepID=A0A434ABL8_9FLAO|nr:NACHT domain-containing protein [Flavobacterium cupreum]RUT71734.1 NACHT domain-containing protein [Flavobacterium cupreum]